MANAKPHRSFAGSTTLITTHTDFAKPKPVRMKDAENRLTSGSPWAKYGDEDTFPSDLLTTLGKLSIGKRVLCANADAHYGAGVVWMKESVDDEGHLIKTPVKIADWDEFVKETNFMQAHSNVIEALETFYWVAVRYLTNEAGTKIREVEALDPTFTRKKKRSTETGTIDSVYFSYKFPETPKEEEYVEYPVYDPTDPYKHKEFVVIYEYTTFGRIYYPIPDYYAVFENGWVDIAISVPQFIKTVYQFSANIKYHIHIPAHYFPTKYKTWDEKNEKEQLKIMAKEQKQMEEFLMGAENAHITFMSVYGQDDDGKAIPGWKIEPIQDYMKKDADLPNNSAANREIMFAMSLDPATIGLGTQGGKDLSGSGSDKREATKVKQAFQSRERLVSLQGVEFVAYFNKMPLGGAVPKYIDVDTSFTLDKNPTGKENNVTG